MTRHLLVIGAQRCGTTYLHTVLDEHPDITMARPARPEPKVFLSADDSARGRDWYLSTYFSHARGERLLGEKSTSYLEHAAAAERAAAVLGPHTEVVVVLRDPVARAVSNWQFSTANGFEDRPVAQALEDNLEHAREWNRSATSVSPFAYLERGRYADYLDPWHARFPGRVHVRFFEELVGHADAVTGLYSALGVEDTFSARGVGDRVNQSDSAPPALAEPLCRRLRAYFEPSDKALAASLGRDLPWAGARGCTPGPGG